MLLAMWACLIHWHLLNWIVGLNCAGRGRGRWRMPVAFSVCCRALLARGSTEPPPGHPSPHRVPGLQEAGQRLVRSAHPLFTLFARLPQQHNILVEPETDGMMMLVSVCRTIAAVLSLLNTVQQASVCFVKVTTNTAGMFVGFYFFGLFFVRSVAFASAAWVKQRLRLSCT